MKTPIAFFIFKRPDTTQQVFNAIRQAKPEKLLVVADAARRDHPQEAEQCAATRAILEQVDWDCEVLTNYAEENLGCKQRLSSGLNWVFEAAETAIILEDDCLPHPSFFPFCEALLERYREDERVFSISGQNVQWGRQPTDYSYYFSRYFHSWGWASWRRAWQQYDVQMKHWAEVRDQGLLKDLLPDDRAVKYWTYLFEATANGAIDTWDYQFVLTCWLQHALCITPNVNLITNIGFGAGATNTALLEGESLYANMPVTEMTLPLQHPPFMVQHTAADHFTQTTLYDVHLVKRAVHKAQRLLKWKRY